MTKVQSIRRRYTRAQFLGDVGLGMLALTAPGIRSAGAESKEGPKAQKTPPVTRWDVVTIGNLSRNRYWGESDTAAVRKAICTCTVVQGTDFRLIVDPSLANADEMASELDRRTGLKLRDLNAAFITHEHADHWSGLAHFTQARWLAAPDVAQGLNQLGKLPKKVEAVTGWLFGTVEIMPTPGHTLNHHSLRFDCDGASVIVAGDAVATRDFWRERRGYFNCVDPNLSTRSMDRMVRAADVIVPGHDNYFVITPMSRAKGAPLR